MSLHNLARHRLAMHAANMSSAALSNSSDGDSSLAGVATKLASAKTNVQIDLDNHYNSKVYTSGSPVSGRVSLTPKRDIPFDSIQIILLGSTKVRLDGVNAPHLVTHTFLKMQMPIPESSYPVPRVLESGQTYAVPFNFVIPAYLTINACSHHVQFDQVRDQHVRMPPTVGFWEKDDMSPQMSQVEYAIKVRVMREPELGGSKLKILEASQQIRVLPASGEEPPLTVTKHDKLYKMSKSKSLKKNILSGKIGRVTAQAIQPPAIVLRPDARGASSSSAHVVLTFDPSAPDSLPPKVTAVSSKLTTHTFYSSGTIATLPDLGDWNKTYAAERRGSYSTSVSLPSKAGPTAWQQHLYSEARRDSGYSSDAAAVDSEGESYSISDDERRGSRSAASWRRKSSQRHTSPIYYTATVEVPIVLPVHKKTFLPNFHSCITSRVYVLNTTVTVGAGSSTTNLSLALPLQVVVDASEAYHDETGLPSFETAINEAEADEFLRPRLLQVPDAQFQGTSQLPGYAQIRA